MSSGGFHVHGPHDHELEHAAHGNDQFASRIAVMTAIMAITLLTKKKWLQYTSYGVALAGTGLAALAWLHI